MLELIHHATVRLIRQSQRNPVLGLLKNILRTVILVAVFYLMITLLGGRPNAIRGDFVLYLMSGVFLYMTHTRAMGAVFDFGRPDILDDASRAHEHGDRDLFGGAVVALSAVPVDGGGAVRLSCGLRPDHH